MTIWGGMVEVLEVFTRASRNFLRLETLEQKTFFFYKFCLSKRYMHMVQDDTTSIRFVKSQNIPTPHFPIHKMLTFSSFSDSCFLPQEHFWTAIARFFLFSFRHYLLTMEDRNLAFFSPSSSQKAAHSPCPSSLKILIRYSVVILSYLCM